MKTNKQIDVLMVKAREHKTVYSEHIEDIRIGYLDSLLQGNGVTTYIMDFAFSASPCEADGIELTEFVRTASPKIIIFIIDKSPTNSPGYTLELLDSLSSAEEIKSIHITLYGNAQVGCFTYFQHHIDSVVLGEEYSALSLVQSVMSGSYPENTNGIAYRNDQKAIVSNQAIQINSLDELPFPTRYALPSTRQSQYAASILSSRGCFGNCSFCYLRAKEKFLSQYAWKGRSAKNVVDEIEQLYKQGITEFFFVDDEFIPYGEQGDVRVIELSEEIKNRNLLIHYSIYSRTDCLTESIIKELSSSGLYCVFLGVESFCQDVLNRYNKGLTVERNLEAITLLKKYDIHIRLGMILFDMDTTMEELGESISALQSILSTKPELLFQSMFFSNMLIPLLDTPSESYIKHNSQISSTSVGANAALQTNYMRRSRNKNEVYKFANPQVDLIYSCVDTMSEQLLQKCIEEENRFYLHGYQDKSMKWFSGVTEFSILQLSLINESIATGKTLDDCNKLVKRNIDMFCLDIAC